MSRLTEAELDENGQQANDFDYVYDTAGNRTQYINAGANQTYNYSYNDAEELTSQSVGSQVTNYTYDANGNLTGESTGPNSSFSYNAKNQTTAIASDSFTYTGPSQTERVQAVTSAGTLNFVNSGLGISSRSGPNGTTYYRRCSCGQLLDEVLPTGGKYYYLFDAQGSVVGLMDTKGQMVNGYDYDPFGNSLFELTQQANPFQFDSGYLDPIPVSTSSAPGTTILPLAGGRSKTQWVAV